MRKQVVGASCTLCKERFYKTDHKETVDKIPQSKVHIVDKLPRYCSRCGGRVVLIKKYVPDNKVDKKVDLKTVTIKEDDKI